LNHNLGKKDRAADRARQAIAAAPADARIIRAPWVEHSVISEEMPNYSDRQRSVR